MELKGQGKRGKPKNSWRGDLIADKEEVGEKFKNKLKNLISTGPLVCYLSGYLALISVSMLG